MIPAQIGPAPNATIPVQQEAKANFKDAMASVTEADQFPTKSSFKHAARSSKQDKATNSKVQDKVERAIEHSLPQAGAASIGNQFVLPSFQEVNLPIAVSNQAGEVATAEAVEAETFLANPLAQNSVESGPRKFDSVASAPSFEARGQEGVEEPGDVRAESPDKSPVEVPSATRKTDPKSDQATLTEKNLAKPSALPDAHALENAVKAADIAQQSSAPVVAESPVIAESKHREFEADVKVPRTSPSKTPFELHAESREAVSQAGASSHSELPQAPGRSSKPRGSVTHPANSTEEAAKAAKRETGDESQLSGDGTTHSADVHNRTLELAKNEGQNVSHLAEAAHSRGLSVVNLVTNTQGGSLPENVSKFASSANLTNQQVAHAATLDDVLAAAETAPAPGLVNMARLVERAGESELQMRLRSAEFGNVSIHTSVVHEQLTARIALEHHDMSKALGGEIANLQEKLSDHGLDARIEVHTSTGNFAGDLGRQQPHEQDRRSYAPVTAGIRPEVNHDPVTTVVTETRLNNTRLDVRA